MNSQRNISSHIPKINSGYYNPELCFKIVISFYKKCLLGEIDIALYIWDTWFSGIGIHNIYNLLTLFIYDYIDQSIPKDLVQLSEIDIELLVWTMYDNTIKIIDIIEKYNNYDILNDFIFKICCYRNNFNIIEYLVRIESRYIIEVFNDNIVNYYKIKLAKNARNN